MHGHLQLVAAQIKFTRGLFVCTEAHKGTGTTVYLLAPRLAPMAKAYIAASVQAPWSPMTSPLELILGYAKTVFHLHTTPKPSLKKTKAPPHSHIEVGLFGSLVCRGHAALLTHSCAGCGRQPPTKGCTHTSPHTEGQQSEAKAKRGGQGQR